MSVLFIVGAVMTTVGFGGAAIVWVKGRREKHDQGQRKAESIIGTESSN